MSGEPFTTQLSKSFDLQDITMTTYSGRTIKLNDMWNQIDIYEDLYNNCLTGQLLIKDHQNLVLNGPFCGRETLKVTFKTPGRAKCTKEFYVYKLGPRQPETNEQSVFYTLSFVSKEFITSQQTKISQHYKGRIHEIVSKIYKDHLKGIPSRLKTSPCMHEQEFIIPYWSPLTAINWLASRAVDQENPDNCNWLFYETLDGFQFHTLSELMSAPPTSAPDSFLGALGRGVINFFGGGTKGKYSDFAYFPKKDRAAERDKEREFKNMERFVLQHQFNTMEKIDNGMYASHLLTHDIVRKKYEHHKYNYNKDFQKNDTLEDNPLVAKGNDQLSNHDWGHYKYYTKHKSVFDDRVDNDKVETWALKRNSQMQQAEAIRFEFTVPGDSERRVGQVVSVTIPNFLSPSMPGQNWYDKYLVGNYLISSIRHSISKENYEMKIQVTRDSLPKPLPDVSSPVLQGPVQSLAEYFGDPGGSP
jgi:hypothetical protein